MNLLVILPILIPLTTAALALLFSHRLLLQRVLGVGGAGALFLAGLALLVEVNRSGIQAVQLGNWPPPFGITLVADYLSAIMVLIAGAMGFGVAVYSLASVDSRRQAFSFWALYHLLLLGVCGAFLTGDIFNLYVWFEVLLIASFVLMCLGGERPQMEGAIKYVTLNLVSSAFFLSGIGLVYGATGTLNMAELATVLHTLPPHLVTALAMLFLIAFGIKSAIFPLFFWLPASYHTPPVAVTALFSALLTKVGVYSLIRFFTLMFTHDVGFTHTLILALAGLTMVTGVFGAVVQMELRRLLSFHIVSQIGYLLMGLGLFNPLGLAAAVYFMAHVIVAKSALFLVSGIIHRRLGSFHLKQVGGLYRSAPLLSLLFLIPALSLAGLPPLSGFFAKLALVRAGLEAGQFAIVAVALGVSVLTLYSMIKIWNEAFWKPLPEAAPNPPPPPLRRAELLCLGAPLAGLAAVTLLLGLVPEPFIAGALRTAEQLLDPAAYVHAVLGGAP